MANEKSNLGEIPTLEQIKRLEKLQGVDAGVYALSVYSVLEAHFKYKLGFFETKDMDFPELADLYERRFSVKHPKEYDLFRLMKDSKRETNAVRHEFKNLSIEEANAATSTLDSFAEIFNLHERDEIKKLAKTLVSWNERKTPNETAKELFKANEELKRISLTNESMAQKVNDYEQKEKELSLLEAKLKTLQIENETETEKNRNNKEKLAALRKQRFDAENEIRKSQKEIAAQMKKLEDAKEYISNLTRMTSYTRTRYDYEKRLVRLTKEQESIVNTVKFSSDFLIKGSAGTGKSLVLLKTLEKLINQNKESLFDEKRSIKLLTFTKSLEKYNKYLATLMNNENLIQEEFISTSESYIYKIAANAFPENSFTFENIKKSIKNSKNIDLEDSIKANPLGNEIFSEIEKFILPNCVTKTEYCDEKIARTGMKKAQGAENRKKIWAAVDKIFFELENKKELSYSYALYKLALKLESGEYKIPDELKTDYLFVDEAQDLPAANLRILKSATRENVILAGDNDQSIFQPGFTWKRAGLDVSGHTRILNTNFRSTEQINDVAEKYRATIKGADKENRPETFRLGPPVELHESDSEQKAFSEIIQNVKICKNYLNYENENICIIMQKKDLLEKMQNLLKSELDLDSDFVNSANFDFSKAGIIRLSTIQSCKGLDFPVVLFYLDHRSHFLDDFDDATKDKMNRNLIYTALTRSIELLHVFTLKDSDAEPIKDLKMILKERE